MIYATSEQTFKTSMDKNAEINQVPVTSHGQSWFEQMHSGAKWKP